jgi:hypothetical protein
MYVLFRSPVIGHQLGFEIQDRISGDARDGVYRKTFTFAQYSNVGTWVVSYIHVLDGTIAYYRWRELNTSYLTTRGFATQLQVINNNEAVPPEISDFNFTPTTVSGFRRVIVTFRARDETSGIRSIYVHFSNPPGCAYYFDECAEIFRTITSSHRISGDDRDGVYRVSFTVNSNFPAGILYASVSATDGVLNRRLLNSASLAALGYPSELRVPATTFAGISGRVTTPDGRAIRNASVTTTDSNGVARISTTSSFGMFIFSEIATGETYTVTVNSKRYRFTPRSIRIDNELTNLDFVGLE